jgi:hypothetical protein
LAPFSFRRILAWRFLDRFCLPERQSLARGVEAAEPIFHIVDFVADPLVIRTGFISLAIGLAWQFKQNLAAGVSPTGAPVLNQLSAPPRQIAQTGSQFFQDYGLTTSAISKLTEALYKLKSNFSDLIPLQRLGTDTTSANLVNELYTACDRAGVPCWISNGHPNSPSELA